MLLFEALEKIRHRQFPSDYEQYARTCHTANDEATEIIKQAEADLIAIKSIEAQMRLSDLLNDLNAMKESDMFSLACVLDFLNECRFDARFDDDGMLISEDEEDGCD